MDGRSGSRVWPLSTQGLGEWAVGRNQAPLIVLPIVLAAGFDPIWFGVYLVIMVELSQITPPVGFSLFVIQGISQEPVSAIIKATIPFFLLMILAVVMIAIWPDIVMYLPNQMSK